MRQLRIELLYVVAFLLGGVGVFYGLADGAFLPMLVGRAQLPQANSALATSSSAARVIGPGVAGLLVQWVTAPFAVLIDAVTFLISALSAALIGTPEPAVQVQERRLNLWQEMSAGLRVIADNPYLRTFALSSAGLDIFWNALYAVYVLYITRVLVLPPATVGLIFSVSSITALASAPIAAAIARRFGLGRTLIVSQVLVSSGSLLIVLAMFLRPAALVLLISAEVVQVCANTIFWINRDSVRQAITPDRLRGRVGAATMCIGLGVALLGTLLGGVLGEYVGISATIMLGGIGGMFSFLWLVFSPVRHLGNIEDVTV
jgi:Na+/melibiose symporter-like transporter